MGINGVHALVYSSQPEAVRAFLRDVLGWSHVDARSSDSGRSPRRSSRRP